MAELVYAGVKYTKTRHAIYCKKCLDTIENKYIHDFKYCSCGSVGIDGGRILGNPGDYEDRSMYCAVIGGKKIWLPYITISHMPTASEHPWEVQNV